jgi:hypothetical protein
LGLALVGVAVVVVDMVYGRGAALVGGAVALLGFVSLWLGVPLLMRASRRAGISAAALASRAPALQPADPPVH